MANKPRQAALSRNHVIIVITATLKLNASEHPAQRMGFYANARDTPLTYRSTSCLDSQDSRRLSTT